MGLFSDLSRRLTAGITTFAFVVTGVIAPAMPASASTEREIAQPSGVVAGWADFAANSRNWYSIPNMQGLGTSVSMPKDNYTEIGRLTWMRDAADPNQAAFKWEMIEGERWISSGREELGAAGISSAQMSSRIDAFPKTASYVFAAYSPDSAELIVEIQKVEKTPTGDLVVYRSDFTPWHGEINKWRRDFLTPSEASDPERLGYNPFQNFKGASVTDHVFHNISWEAVGVVIGQALRHSNGHIGWIVNTKQRFAQNTKKSGNIFKKKVTTYIDGYAKPQWFVATPIEMQPEGGMSAICVTNVGLASPHGNTATCDVADHVAPSNISISEWKGGNLPEQEELLYHFQQTKSGFTVLFFTILTFVATWGIASALAGVVGPALAASGATLNAVGAGVVGAGIYAGASGVLLGANGITDVQNGFLGNVGNGVVIPNTGIMDQHQLGLRQAVQNKQIYSRIGTGLTGVQEMYAGNCPEDYSAEECKDAGLSPGTMRRPDSYRESNTTLQLRAREAECKSQYGLAGVLLQKCAAPKAGVWTVETGQ